MPAGLHGIAGVQRQHSDSAVTEHQRKSIATGFRHGQQLKGDLARRIVAGADQMIAEQSGERRHQRLLVAGTSAQIAGALECVSGAFAVRPLDGPQYRAVLQHDRQLKGVPGRIVGQAIDQMQRAPQMGAGLGGGRAFDGTIGRALPVADGACRLAGAIPVLGQHFGLVVADVGEQAFQRIGDALMNVATPRPQQSLVGGILQQCVPKHEEAVGLLGAHLKQIGFHQLVEVVEHLLHRLRQHRMQQCQRKLPADRRTYLRDFLDTGQAVKSRDQRILQRDRDRRGCGPVISLH